MAVIGVFGDEQRLLSATRAVRERGWAIRDAHTPYAVHGLDEAMGLPRTRLTRVCLVLGLSGAALALLFQLWAFGRDWPINVGGKSDAALPALAPITFETAVLFAALGTVVALFARSGLRPGRPEALPAEGVTDDRFALVVASGTQPAEQVAALLTEHGALEVRHQEGEA
jgi:hypothetical protein